MSSSDGGGIGGTLTGGIQDVAAILPLLGTEQCSIQVSSALTRGYLYAASSPMSIFGSLGVVTAGFKTLVACFSFGDIEGAKILGNMGFEPQGENLSLIMVETGGKGKKNTGRYIIETRMDELIKELNIDKSRITGVLSHKSAAWNIKMMATTALLAAFSIAPYIFLNLDNSLNNTKKLAWVFPVLRATGGFITATLIQLLIQQRITILSDQYLVQRHPALTTTTPVVDSEAAIPGTTKKHQIDARTWLMLFLLLIGLVASIVGYVGCFSVVQNSTSNVGPVSWLCLEIGLSVIRLAIWAWNPTGDDAPPLEIVLKLDEHKPFPTCNKDNEEILRYKVLPLTRARDFLKIITSFAGLIHPFSNPDLSLYYTLTRKRSFELEEEEEIVTVPADIENDYSDGGHEPIAENAKDYNLGESALYITVFDHKERTTRVYTRDNEIDIFYSTKSDAPIVDVGHFVLEVEIGIKIDPKGDPISNDRNNLDSLRKHHQSILEHIYYQLGAGDDVTRPYYAIENNWTMKAEDTKSTLQRLREDENGNGWKPIVENGKKKERLERDENSSLICDYFMHSSIDRERRLLDDKRVKWIARRMEMITKEMKERFRGIMGAEYRVDKQTVEKKPATKPPEEIDRQLIWEQRIMELLLVYEVNEWEQLFWTRFKSLLDRIGNDQVEVKERLTREWRADCWRRLNSQLHAAQKRLADEGNNNIGVFGTVNERWTSSINRFFQGVENQNSMSLREEIKSRIGLLKRRYPLYEIRPRIENEMDDIDFRLKRGSELGRFDQFWDDDILFQCRYSRSKWLNLRHSILSAPLEIYSHALKGNKNIIHIGFDPQFDVTRFPICDLPRVTSISSSGSFGLLAIHDGPLFIKSTDNNDLITFANEIRPKLDRSSIHIFTDANYWTDITSSGELKNYAKVLISFVAPTSSCQSLTLRLKHSGGGKVGHHMRPSLEVTLGSTIIQLNPSSSKSSLTIDDITLYPAPAAGPSESDHLSFKPGLNNNIVIQFGPFLTDGHLLHDIELLDEAGLKDPRNQIINADSQPS